MYNIIKERFNSKFDIVDDALTEEDLYVGNKKIIPTQGWILRIIMQEDELGTYVEYYATNTIGCHLHERIYSDGTEEQLDVLRQYIVYSPSIPGDRERSARDFENYNRRLISELKSRGLM